MACLLFELGDDILDGKIQVSGGRHQDLGSESVAGNSEEPQREHQCHNSRPDS